MNTDDLIQYIITFDVAPFPKQYVVSAGKAGAFGRFVAAHKNIDAVRVAIPSTHVKANFAQPAPIIEVWVDKRIAGK